MSKDKQSQVKKEIHLHEELVRSLSMSFLSSKLSSTTKTNGLSSFSIITLLDDEQAIFLCFL
ncbi:hypothetical protein HYC85_013371 [Camellia sinensis]|uniref:Uncharacterized protein n=1 Tax=Camellia sinensis TaxID=4442 RepID=A0A7J7H6D4_CAMSI|nr:hypothetical protein HYC85_013371 [Camellia sinensis]